LGKAFLIRGQISVSISRFVITGLSGGSGKTIVSLGLCREFSRRSIDVRPFKKGPDYIDARWLGIAAGQTCSNLDPHFLPMERIRSQFAHYSDGGELAVIEGNRGLFDGKDEHGSCSTAELARQLDAPVFMVLDATKMTRTAAAVVAGCATFEKNLNLAGVILNRTAGERHRSILEKSIRTHTDIPVLGMLPKIRNNPIPERHMGLVSDLEYDAEGYKGRERALDAVADLIRGNVDIDAIRCIADQSPDLPAAAPLWPETTPEKTVRIGYVYDDAFWFYYRENLEALERAGADLIRLSLLSDEPWPELDGLYIGGGFPETFASALADKTVTRKRVRALSEAGVPIYAECGGFMYLCDALEFEGATYPMAGVFPVTTSFCPRPQGLGYTCSEVVAQTPFFNVGDQLLGHEFHYSHCVGEAESSDFALRMKRGGGMIQGMDGLVRGNTFAAYNHIHALAVPDWATRFVAAAETCRSGR
jgi:cobyrinic acid a,c-diamide synthase